MEIEHGKNCLTCCYRVERVAPPPQILRVNICQRFPPVPVIVQGPHGEPGQLSVFPLVSADIVCAEYAPAGAANG